MLGTVVPTLSEESTRRVSPLPFCPMLSTIPHASADYSHYKPPLELAFLCDSFCDSATLRLSLRLSLIEFATKTILHGEISTTSGAPPAKNERRLLPRSSHDRELQPNMGSLRHLRKQGQQLQTKRYINYSGSTSDDRVHQLNPAKPPGPPSTSQVLVRNSRGSGKRH